MPTPADLSQLHLQVYTADWCPDCRRLDRWLKESEVPHQKVDIETVAGAAEKLEAETGKRAIPFVLVNRQHWVRGYHRELSHRFDPSLFILELVEAGSRA